MKDTSEEAIKEVIKKFLKDNYECTGNCKISKKPINGKYVVDCSGNLGVENGNITSLTNEYFEFGTIGGIFDCSFCPSLTSLEGAPKKVGGYFNCSFCPSLTSLEGAPEKVGGTFICVHCKIQFTISDVRKTSKVNGEIHC